MKVDIEGNELRFFRGVGDFLRHLRPKTIFFEFWNWWIEWTGCITERGFIALSNARLQVVR